MKKIYIKKKNIESYVRTENEKKMLLYAILEKRNINIGNNTWAFHLVTKQQFSSYLHI